MSESLRMCCVCRQMMPKEDLIRIVKNKDGEIFVDNSGKANGRGTYICKNEQCISKLKKQKSLNKAFKCQVSDEIYETVEKSFKN